MCNRLFSGLLFLCLSFHVLAQTEVRVGVLKFGTVNWEIDVIKHHKLDEKYQFKLKVTSLASKNASAVALQSDAVDIILSDWFWVNRQRFEHKDYTLFPTSRATGGLYIASSSGMVSLNDLTGKTVGIAGGAVDKNWLLLQAYSQSKYQLDLKAAVDPVFAAPPLLNRLMMRGDLASTINFWHYGARLKAAGYKPLVTVPEMLAELGVDAQIPLLGWVFSQRWANENPRVIEGFLQASLEAKRILFSSDLEWQRISALVKAENPAVFAALKADYRAGLLGQFGEKELAGSKHVFTILAKQGGSTLVGKATTLSEGTFWKTNLLADSFNAKVAQ